MENKAEEKKLGPIHIWALGVGIVLVGEFMGWNFTIQKGGSTGALIAIWAIAIMYICIVMMTTEMASVMPEAGGQFAIAKYTLGPVAAFNVALMSMLEYAMLEAADAVVVGEILQVLNPDINPKPFIILSLLVLAFINYRGAYATLTLNFIITIAAFSGVMILFFSTNFYNPQTTLIHLKEMTDGLPFGILGIAAAMQFGIWFFLGIEGTAMASDECKNKHRALPVGTIIGLSTLLIGANITWFVCSGMINAKELGTSVYPLYDAAVSTGKFYIIWIMFAATILSCLASANGCINDAARAWSALSSDTLLPEIFAKKHPKYNTPYRSIIFLLPISAAFAFTGLLDQIITFSIFSALMIYLLTAVMMIKFRKMYPLGKIKRGYCAPLHPLPAVIAIIIASIALLGMFLSYSVNMLACIIFYSGASVWFIKRRYKFVNKKEFLKEGLKLWGYPH